MKKLEIKIQEVLENEINGDLISENGFIFGQTFSDRMFQMLYKSGEGWTEAEIKKFENFSLSPATVVFHYGQTIFEGLKAYRRTDGQIGLFRAKEHFKRMNESAERMCMPTLDIDFCLKALKELVKLQEEWFPKCVNSSIYIRPVMLAIDPVVRLRPSSGYLFYIILSPININKLNSFVPLKVFVENKYVRASQGGVGFAKTSNNYSASLIGSVEAQKKGFDHQVLWLDGIKKRYIEECSSMNIFFRYKDKLVTPSLNDSILHGITRDSVIKIARHWGIDVEEDALDIKRITEDIKTGKIIEAFGSGTLIDIRPIGMLHYEEKDFYINDNKPGELSHKLFNFLSDIKHGNVEDNFKWTEII